MPSITDVEGIRVGHWSDEAALTGCTVVLPPKGTVASCEVRGGRRAPAARTCFNRNAARGGARDRADRWERVRPGYRGWRRANLEERGIGSEIGPVIVPSVAAAVIFDLGVGDPTGALVPRRDTRHASLPPSTCPRGGSARGREPPWRSCGDRHAGSPAGSARGRFGTATSWWVLCSSSTRWGRSWTRTDRCSLVLGWSPENGAKISSNGCAQAIRRSG